MSCSPKNDNATGQGGFVGAAIESDDNSTPRRRLSHGPYERYEQIKAQLTQGRIGTVEYETACKYAAMLAGV